MVKKKGQVIYSDSDEDYLPPRRKRRLIINDSDLDDQSSMQETKSKAPEKKRRRAHKSQRKSPIHEHPPYAENRTTNSRRQDDDEEEKFQKELENAIRESLESFQAEKHLKDELGTGLKNDVGEYNCFLNVIIQSLWHMVRFREEFIRSSHMHAHLGNPCAICALAEIFKALELAHTGIRKDPVDPQKLRAALSGLYPTLFQEAEMNDASEVLSAIFDCLHRSFTSSEENDDWDCHCIAHVNFGMDIREKMRCSKCGNESRHLNYTSFFHHINAYELRKLKVSNADNSFEQLQKNAEINNRITCHAEASTCGKSNYSCHILSTAPKIFTTVLGWQNAHESKDAISDTLVNMSTQIDLAALYDGLDEGNKHSLISMVCYYGQHYQCFTYNDKYREWIMYDDKTIKRIGKWNDVISKCVTGRMQPQVLMFESKG